jgi:hypothetical protein
MYEQLVHVPSMRTRVVCEDSEVLRSRIAKTSLRRSAPFSPPRYSDSGNGHRSKHRLQASSLCLSAAAITSSGKLLLENLRATNTSQFSSDFWIRCTVFLGSPTCTDSWSGRTDRTLETKKKADSHGADTSDGCWRIRTRVRLVSIRGFGKESQRQTEAGFPQPSHMDLEPAGGASSSGRYDSQPSSNGSIEVNVRLPPELDSKIANRYRKQQKQSTSDVFGVVVLAQISRSANRKNAEVGK